MKNSSHPLQRVVVRIYLVTLFTLFLFAPNIHVAAQCNAPVFSGAPSYAADRGARSVAVGEFNGDGKLDLAVANSTANNISILLGDGFGGFGPPTNFVVHQQPSAVATGDFNKDGKTDLAVAHLFGGSAPISVLFGAGNGTFSGPTNIGSTSNATGLAVADFNNDGNPDIAASSLGFQLILLGNGAGSFTPNNVAIGPTGSTASVAAADFNGDGYSDAAFASDGSGSWRVWIVFGNNAGLFSVNVTLAVSQAPKGIAVGNFNGDTNPDLVVIGEHSQSTASVFINQGGGTFSVSTEFLVGRGPRSVTVSDFNADGNDDIAVGLAEANNVMIAVGVGQGTFLTPTYFGTGFTPMSIASGDFNGDNKLDLVTANAANTFLGSNGPAGVSILIGKGSAVFETYRSFSFQPALVFAQPNAAATADFDKDGRPDLATSYIFSPLINVMRSDGTGGLLPFGGFDTGGSPTLVTLATADFNKDGNPDVVAANDNNGIVRIFFGTGSASFSPVVDVATTTNVKTVAVGDFNGDGNQDIIVTRANPANALVLLGNGVGAFVQPGATTPPAVEQIVVADFNGDGKSDIASSHVPQGNISIFLGDALGHLNLAGTTPFPGLITEVRLASADLNGDGRADIVTANSDRNDITVLLGDGAGGLAAGTNFAAAPRPLALAIADYNGDGKLDVAVANNGGQVISIFRGTGDGGLAPPTVHPVAVNPNGVVQADFNQDGKPDLAVLSGTSGLVSILLNLTSDLPCLNVNDVTLTEGDAGSTNADFVVSLSRPSSETVRVNYSLVSQTATTGSDYAPVAGRLVFAPGETSKTISVPVFGDLIDEIDETFTLQLASPSGSVIGDGEGLGTIIDNDPLPSITIGDITNVEASLLRNFTVTLSAASGKTITVQYATANGTATGGTFDSGADYFPGSGTLTIPAGQTSGQISISTFGDDTFEPDETFFLNLSNPTNATLSDTQAQGTILNDDPIPKVDVFDAFIIEGNTGTTIQSFNVRLSNPSYQTITLNYATSDNTATASSDYVATSGSLTFPPGEVQRTIFVLVNGDTVDETTENFFVDISDVQNATVGTSRANGFIFDDDGPTISINDVRVAEGNAGTTTATFTITLSAPSVETINVRASVAPGTATAITDYSPFSMTFVIPPGTATRTVNVPVIGDTNIEADETFFVNLSNPFNATIADSQGIGTILDDDGLRLILDDAGPDANQAIAFDSILLVRDPFHVMSIASWLNLGSDRNTRVLLFAGNLQLAAGEPPSTVVVSLLDSNNQSFEIPAEDVRASTNSNFTQVVFTLPDNLAPGVVMVTIKAGVQTSNKATLRIAP